MKEPLNSFADRIIRNDEVKEFIQGLIEKDFSIISEIKRVIRNIEISDE